MSLAPTLENNQWGDVQILKQVFPTSPDQILIIDPRSMKFRDATQAALTSLGYTKEEFLNLKPDDIDAVYSLETMAAAFDGIIKSKEQHATLPTIHRRKDKSTIEVEVYLRCFKVNNDNFILVSATERSVLTKAQEELKFHSTLFNNISDAIVATDESFNITSYNQSAAQIFGWKEEEVLGKNTREITASIYPDASSEEVTECLFKNGSWRGEIITHRKNGEKFPALISISTLKDASGKITGTVAVIRDISEERRQGKKIAYMASLVDKVNDGIISVNANYNIVSWNKGAENIYGFTYEEVTGKTIFTLWLRSNLYQRKSEILNILQQNGYWQGEIKHYHKDNSEVWTLVSASVLKDENGILNGFVVVSKDITDRKKLEVRLQKFNEELEQRVRDKTEEVVSIFDRITDGFIAVDRNWNFTYVNKEAGQIYSRNPDELIGENLWEEFPDVISHPFYHAFHAAMDEQKAVQVNNYYPPFNKWLEGSIYPSANGLTVYFRDITGTKKSELALKESELRYRTLVETANEGIWQVDENNITTYANDYLASLLGYSTEQMIGKDAFDFISDTNKEKVLRNLEERKKGISSQHELTFVNRKQQTIITLIQSTPLYKEGKYAGSISMLLDITKRKEAEGQLVANERRFRALIENSSDGIALISAEGNLLYNSPSGKKITGYKNEEIIGTNRLKYIHPDDHEKVKISLKALFENPVKVHKIELRYLVKEGSCKWLECSYSNLLNDPSVNAIIVNYRDITERKNAEKQLQKNEEQLSLIYNSSIVGMWLINVEDVNQFRYATVNNAYINVTGKTKEEVVGRLLEEVVPANNIVQVKAKYIEAAQTAQIVNFFTTAIFKIAEITAEIKIIPIKNEEGKVVQLLGTANDVTEQKKARRELLQMNIQLRELASHLQTIREDERTSMAREIHDELGQQLTVLKMDLSWLNKKLMPREENIENKLKGALELIDSTINTVRKIAAELRPGILDDLGLAEAIDWQSREFTNRTGIPVTYAYRGKADKLPPTISIGIFRVFQESLTNVARHANATQVDCLLQNADNNLSLIISDNGVGFKLNGKGERKTLGLLGMKERIMMLNGKFNVASEPGKGTTVSVEVPLPLPLTGSAQQ
ncbi:MAG: hypothetical protein JWR18_2991 [Segetibacter sp.]|nr:hypothetical protein [Segetibacter sp.]